VRGTDSFIPLRDATAARRNGVFINLISLEEIQMLAVYRGVPYNTDREFTQEVQYRKVQVTYRGVQHTETIKVVEVQK